MKGILPISISAFFWSLVGMLRYGSEAAARQHDQRQLSDNQLAEAVKEVAVCVPAHNEALIIEETVNSLQKLVPARQIYVASDGSTDQTAATARRLGCIVLEINPGVGKARALQRIIGYFRLLKRYRYLLIADADTVFDSAFLSNALSLFDKKKRVAVVAAYTRTRWPSHKGYSSRRLFIAYRLRLYCFIQAIITYGQTWHRINVSPVIPGFACLYRTEVLQQMTFDVPGIIIEDFNMAFQLHKKNLGTIAFDPSVTAATQDPDNLTDYWRQVYRWNLGLFQTIKHWGVWPSAFWLSLSVYVAELFIFSVLLLLFPIALVVIYVYQHAGQWLPFADTASLIWFSRYWNDLLVVYIAILLIDFLLTLGIAIIEREDRLAVYGLFFIFIRYIDAIAFLQALIKAFNTTSSGIWSSPARRL